jgi:3',5'-cyclic-nucleotide phosphodiesterase
LKILSTLFFLSLLVAPVCARPVFNVVVLGSGGGLNEANLSAYLVGPVGEQRYVAHFDHISGLVLGSPEDSSKPIFGLAPTLDTLRDCVFQPRVWANFTNEGPGATGKYTLKRVAPGETFRVEGMPFHIQAYPLSHTPGMLSTAFVIQQGDDALVYCGDTGADANEGQPYLGNLWKRLAPVVRSGHLHGIFLECSFPSARPDGQLFGHLTPRWLMREMHQLALEVGDAKALQGLTVAVTHIKPGLSDTREPEPRDAIEHELEKLNDLGLHFVFPRQGNKLEL